MMISCTSTNYNYKLNYKRSMERFYSKDGRYIGRSVTKEYSNGRVDKIYYDRQGHYIGRSRSN